MQKKLSESKSRSFLSSFEESTKLLANVEQLRNQQAEILAKGKEANSRSKQLIAIVGSSPGQTSDTSILLSERVFRQNLAYYTETSAKLANLLSKLAANHLEVIAEKLKQQQLQSALLSRSRLLLGSPIDIKTLEQLSLNVHNTTWKSRESVFQELKEVRIERQRLRNKAEEIDQQINQFESQIAELAHQELELNSSHDVEIADAVFASNVANSSDVSKSNAAYLPQMLVKPSLAEETISPNLKLILLAALTQSQQWFTKTTRMATLVMLLGLTGGSWVTNELLIPQIAQAETARIDLSVTSKPNETYETLVSRAEGAVLAAVQDKFDQNKHLTSVTVMVMAENYGSTAPLLSLEVSRNQWQKNPDIEIWSTYFANARSLLGLSSEVATTNSSTPATDTVIDAVNSYVVSSLETVKEIAPTPQTNTVSKSLYPEAATDTGSNRESEFSSVTNKTTPPQIANTETVLLNISITSQPNETYETLVSRAEEAVLAAVEENFDQNKKMSNVTVMVMAENYGSTAPVLSLEVSRSQWHKSPDIQRWGTYFTSARSLLGFNSEVATTISTTPTTNSAVIAKQPVNSYVSRLETVNEIAPTSNQITTPSKATNPVSVANAGNNYELEFSAIINKTTAPQTTNPEAASIDLWVTRQLDETYETLLSRAEQAVLATVEENFDKNKQISNVTVMVMAENYGATAPVLSLEVSRNQWRKSPNIQRWGTYLMSARSLLGFKNVATTNDLATDSFDQPAQSEIDSLYNSNSSNPATDTFDPSAQPETDDSYIDSLDNSNSSDPPTVAPVPSQQPPNSTAPNSAFPSSIQLVN
ncbi:MAG: hypothetical protein KME05_18530 [Gloeocapsa sp. UFS-A4-WI-NPMV-4B04]|nr:hypothetical protein [Gloeocapsa sp. UFS-A4-WI-NPMV-4B04]